MTVKPILNLLRVNQWVKNLFLFIPIFFAGELFDPEKLFSVLIGFFAFSLVSSAVYVLNDYKDINEDKLHKEKRHRPIAAGIISKGQAIIIMALVIFTGFGLSLFLPGWFTGVIIIYLLINILYSAGLKKISILDLMIVSLGFILRVVAGGIASDIALTHWLIVMIFLLSLFIVIAKRRDDMIEFIDSGKVVRASIQKYNLQYINSILTMISGIIIVAYIMYTISPDVETRFDTEYLYFTSLFVTAGLMRYLQITLVENNSGSPVKLLYRDKFIQVTLLCWMFSFFFILYIFKVKT